ENKKEVAKLLERRQYKKARNVCERMFSESIPDSEVYFFRAMAEINFINNNFSKCISYCKRGLTKNNKSTELLFLQAKALFATEEFNDVIDITDQLKDMVPRTNVKAITPSSISASSAAAKDKKAMPSPIPKTVTLLDVLSLE